MTLSNALGPNDLVGRCRVEAVDATEVVDCAEEGVGREDEDGIGTVTEDSEATLVEERGVMDWIAFIES